MLRQFRSNPLYGKTTEFVLHEASPQKRARRRIIKSIGLRQFKKQQRRFIDQQLGVSEYLNKRLIAAQEMAGAV